jgi:hypothetical protein
VLPMPARGLLHSRDRATTSIVSMAFCALRISCSAARRHPVEQYDASRPGPSPSARAAPHFRHVITLGDCNFSTYMPPLSLVEAVVALS